MSWLFWILLVMVVLFMLQGFRKGLIRTAVSMVSFVIVMLVTAWLNPYVGDFIRERTNWEENIKEKCSTFLADYLEEQVEISAGDQAMVIEELPLPQSMKEKLAENNNSEIYRRMAVESFADYLSGSIAYSIINGIGFLISFLVTIVIIKMILYAVDILTELPVIGGMNRLGGLALGAAQGILWIWILFLVVTLLCNTKIGGYLMGLIHEDPILLALYDKNLLMEIVMGFFS